MDAATRKPPDGDLLKNGRVLNEHLPTMSTTTSSTHHHTTSASRRVTVGSDRLSTQPGSGVVDTSKILDSVYGGSSPSSRPHSSPPRPNPQAVFGPVTFKHEGVMGTSSAREGLHVQPVDTGTVVSGQERK